MFKNVHKLILEMWETEEILEDLNLALICPIHKKDDKKSAATIKG